MFTCSSQRRPLVAPVLLIGLLGASVPGAPIHVTYLWHMHQPIYYPYESINDTIANNRFNFSLKAVHDNRRGNYTSWPKNAVQQGHDRGMAHAGAQCSFSGSLGENLNNLAGVDGNWVNWFTDYRWARNSIKTSLNNPRLDLVGIANHHSLMPLTCKESMKMQIRLHKEVCQDMWGTAGYSKGFWPPECAFAEWIIPALVEEGLEWVLVDNGHFDRACLNYPWVDATSIRPNKADQLNPDPAELGSQWVQLNNIYAPSKVSAPWGYQPHYVKHVNPWTGAEQKIIAVPCGRYEGNENARGGYGAFKPQNVWGALAAAGINNDPNHPMIIVCHSDGDNYGTLNSDAWHAQHGYFLDMCQTNPDFAHTTVQDYLQMWPPSTSDVIHVEPGSWIGIDGGTPYFEKWRENNAGYKGDPNEHPDFWSWSVIVAAQNRVLHADKLESGYSMNDVQWGIGSDTAKAWHFYLQGETSCHWYWDYDRDNPWDGNATRACNLAVAEANKVIARHLGNDPQGPSIFPPQRDIYNPGGKHWNEATNQPSNFQVWTFIDDVNGVSDARVRVRADLDGQNPIAENDNEVYARNPAKVGEWQSIAMTNAWYPLNRGPQVPEPLVRAKRYWGTVSGYTNVLLDYFVEAVDTRGNTNRSDIFHVWVGALSAGGANEVVTYAPDPPRRGENCAITYNSAGRNLSTANPVYIHLGFNNWSPVISPDAAMTGTPGGTWSYTFFISNNYSQVDCVFNNGSGTWDNNSGADWHKATVEGGPVASTVSFNPASPDSCNPVMITYSPNDTGLTNAVQVYIHLLYNSGQQTNHAGMTKIGLNWQYTTQILPYGTTNLVCSFNDAPSPSAGAWDDNAGAGWKVTIAGCSEPPPPPYVTITNPPVEILTVAHAVSNYPVAGTCGTGVVGFLQWSNSLGGAGSLPVSASWGFDAALAVGTNVITVTGTNASLPSVKAADSATNSTYNAGWTNGSSGGSGFGAWVFYRTTNDSNRAGWFLASGAANCNIGGKAWGLYANSGELSEAKRSFSSPLAAGDTFSVKLDNGTIQTTGSVGIALQNAGGSTLWQFYFAGGGTNYVMTGTNNTGIALTTAGMNVDLTLTGAGAFSAKIGPYGSATQTFSGNLESQTDMSIAGFRVWNYTAGPGSGADLFVNDLSVTGVGGSGLSTGDTARIIRQPAGGFVDSDGDGMDDNWELEKFGDLTTAHATSDWDGDRSTDREEFLAGTDPKNPLSLLQITNLRPDSLSSGQIIYWSSVGDRIYAVLATTNIMDSFSLREGGLPGTPPENVYTDTTATLDQRFYRIRTQRE